MFRNFVLENFPFLENDFDAMTDYELFCKMVEYMKKSLQQIEGFQSQINIFSTKLDEFENYFDNLDVTEEVNAKLDEMVEDGTMEELIAEYLQLQTTYTYNSVDDLKSAENLVNGMFVRTSGYYSYNDGGGAFYKVRNVTTDDVVDDMFIIELANNEVIAELIIDDELKITQLGINSDATNNTTKMQAALSYISTNSNIKLKINKAFSVNTIDFTGINHVTIEGNNKQTGINVIGADGVGVTLNTNLNTFINLNLHTSSAITLVEITGTYNHFINCRFIGSADSNGVYINDKWSNVFDDCEIREFNKCIYLNGQANFTVFNNCVIIANDTSSSYTVQINGGDEVIFDNCEIEKGVNNIYVTDGQCSFTNNYIEGASGNYAVELRGGNTVFTNNYFSNSKIAKYTNNKLTLSHNIIRKVQEDGYLLYPMESDIGYLVVENNVLKDTNGRIMNVNFGNRNDAVPRYYNGSGFANGTANDYIYVNQNDCFTVEPAGKNYVYIRKNNLLQGGTTSILPPTTTVGLQAGQTFGDRNRNKLLFYNAYLGKWVDFMGNTPSEKRTSAPSSGTWQTGDIVFNSSPSAGGTIGWVCVSGGTPGTWKTFGSISS